MTAHGHPSSCNKPSARSASLDTKTVIAPSASNVKAVSDKVFQKTKTNQDCKLKFTTASYCQGNPETPFL